MKVALISLNSKYIHTNLAIRYLAECISPAHQVALMEYTIQDNPIRMAAEISQYHPDVVCFSVYLWNTLETMRLSRVVKKVMPDVMIVMGGPEVSFNAETVLHENPEIDVIVIGEGEKTFRDLISQLCLDKNQLMDVSGIVWRSNQSIVKNPQISPVLGMETIPFPYTNESSPDPKRIYYYESSRGCPFSCSFCISSLDRSVRALPCGRVQKELDWLLQSGIRLVKFVDRTFNYDAARALNIWRYLKSHYNRHMVFHFEIAADLLNDETIDFLATVPDHYFQFEIGVQSTNLQVLDAVDRQTDIGKICEHVKRLKGPDNIHLHLDLIAGLPYEDLTSFEHSFNQVYAMEPHMLQLGFLKVLPGTKILRQAQQWQYVFMPDPPYQVLSNRWLSFSDLNHITHIESVFDCYYNSGRFYHVLRILTGNKAVTPFKFYQKLTATWRKEGLHLRGVGVAEQFAFLARFISTLDPDHQEKALEALKFDYFLFEKPGHFPDWFENMNAIPGKTKQKMLEYMIPNHLPHLKEERSGRIRRNTEIAFFQYDCISHQAEPVYYLFEYNGKDAANRTRYLKVDDAYVQDIMNSPSGGEFD